MNLLIVADDVFNPAPIATLTHSQPCHIQLFSLTSNCQLIDQIRATLATLVPATVSLLPTATLINDEVNLMQKGVHQWSAQLGNQEVNQKKLKDWFMLPDGSGSAWWLSLIAEKNSVQDDVFFKLAQINAIKKYLQTTKPKQLVICLKDRRLSNILCTIAKKLKIPVTAQPGTNKKIAGFKNKLLNAISALGILGAILSALMHFTMWLRDGILARKKLGSTHARVALNNPLLFVTYFPNLDEDAAKKGVFRNKYALALQDKLAELNIPITWLAMPVNYNGHHFGSALQLAKTFNAKGERLFILQEFFTLGLLFQSIYWWLRQAIRGAYLYYRLDKKLFTQHLTHQEALPLIQYMWWHSFLGTSSVRGIIFYLTYKKIFRTLPNIKNCLYFCEMQAWEKALILAKKTVSPKTQTLAFQHTVVMRNYFNYFYAASDMTQTNQISDMPLPDRLIANGKLMHTLLAESAFPNLCEAEAIRQLYLSKTTTPKKRTTTAKVILVAGSYDRNETKSLISMVYSAYPEPRDFLIWFKGSPVNPLAPLFKELGIDVHKSHYHILHDDIGDLLAEASIAFVANTTVAIEAQACGCRVIVPILADTMLMNPIVDTKANYLLASTAHEFKMQVDQLLKQAPIKNRNRDVDFINSYWNIDSQLPLWTNLLLT